MRLYHQIIVSNRLPINIERKNGALSISISSGGLATAMSSLDASERIWVGWPGIASDELSKKEQQELTKELAEQGYVPVFLTKSQIDNFYDGYSNDTIWPLFHYFQSLVRHTSSYWHSYKEVNDIFAATISKYAASDAKIWIQDYHLMLLPQLMRDIVPGAAIGFFLHIPFPSFEIFRLLPERKEVLAGLLGSDVVGFHIFDYGRHFLSSCMRLLSLPSTNGVIPLGDRSVKVGTYPIGIDYEKFQRALKTAPCKRALKRLDAHYKGQKLVLSVDRLDYSKGIPHRLEAFKKLLGGHPEYHGKVRLLMIAVPSRVDVEAYQSLREQIEQLVSRINGEYGTVDWTPISYQFQNLPFSEIVALYARADVMLVTPIRDGMNLVAKEYVASKTYRTGTLILSEMTGASDELSEALLINPNNIDETACAIHRALSMPKKEQRERLRAMRERLEEITVQTWGNEFMRDLEVAAGERDQQFKKRIARTQKQRTITRYKNAHSRLIILDYDGTVRQFVGSPSTLAGTPSLKLRRIIRQLSEQPNTTVALVSGRPRKALSRWFFGLDIILAAEHGAWTRYNKTWHHIESDFSRYKDKVLKVMDRYVRRTKGSQVEEKDYSLVWHYANVSPELAYNRARELRNELAAELKNEDIAVYSGHNILEIKPQDITKSRVATELLRKYTPDFVFCAGDDYTDEDMFKVLDERAVTIKVGQGETAARYQVSSVEEVLDLLEQMIATTRKKTLLEKLPLPLKKW